MNQYNREDDIGVLLDFIERWNKGDAELEVAQAAARLEKGLKCYRRYGA